MQCIGEVVAAVLAVAVLSTKASLVPCSGPQTTEEFVTQVIGSPGYHYRNPPDNLPVHVETQLLLSNLDNVNAKKGQVAVGGYWRQYWKDERLAYNDTATGGCFDSVDLSNVALETTIWSPNLYVDNGVSIKRGNNLLSIRSDGSVSYSEYVYLTVKIKLSFGQLPFDSHAFTMSVASYSLGHRFVRLTAKGGVVGEAEGGEAITGQAVTAEDSPTWDVNNAEPLSTPGRVRAVTFTSDSWDYLDLTFDFARRPKFMIDQVLVQDTLFLVVTYAGLFINPSAAPARAAFAVFPVLILRSLLNSVYASIPEVGYPVWLGDYLLVSMFLMILASFQLALVNFFMRNEDNKRKRYETFKQSKDEVEKLIDKAREKKVALGELMHDFQKQPKGDNLTVSYWTEAVVDPATVDEKQPEEVTQSLGTIMLQEKMANVRGPKQAGQITEEDIELLNQTLRKFKNYDKDDSNSVGVHEVQDLLHSFNFYLLDCDVATTMCRCLRDHGFTTPKVEMNAVMSFAQFVHYVFQIDNMMGTIPRRAKHPLSKAWSYSERSEIFMRWLYPVLIVFKIVIFFALLPAYS